MDLKLHEINSEKNEYQENPENVDEINCLNGPQVEQALNNVGEPNAEIKNSIPQTNNIFMKGISRVKSISTSELVYFLCNIVFLFIAHFLIADMCAAIHKDAYKHNITRAFVIPSVILYLYTKFCTNGNIQIFLYSILAGAYIISYWYVYKIYNMLTI